MRKRSAQLELLDQDGHSFEAIRQNMVELEYINSHLGGHAITLRGVRRLANGKHGLSIAELGCGGGDNLKAIHKELKGLNNGCHFIGIDINANCIAYAQQNFGPGDYIVSDYRKVSFKQRPDIIFSSLFCHHFTDEELVEQFRWMKENARIGFFINDLHRNWIAYTAIRILTQLFSSSFLVKHDAPLSVLRGFNRSEIRELMAKAGISQYELKWQWAFRWLLVVKKEPSHDQ